VAFLTFSNINVIPLSKNQVIDHLLLKHFIEHCLKSQTNTCFDLAEISVITYCDTWQQRRPQRQAFRL